MKTCPSCKKKVKPDKSGKCPDCGADLSKVTEEEEPQDPLAEGAVIEGDDLAPLIEAAELIVPKKGKLFEERVIEGGHTVKVARFAIIRPCQSRGRRIRGHAPIYEPRMLAENASVFTGWPMYLDHASEELAEALAEFLQEKGRSIKDLGGRVIRSFYDPEVSLESDDANGYRKGAVVGEIVPQRLVREMLEEDPMSLAVSINAWPKRVRIGSASWSSTVKGAVIEGIRAKPMGSVDFVPRGGAGGRLLTEEEIASAVSLLESAYTASRDGNGDNPEEPAVKKKLSEMSQEEIASLTREQLAEAIKAENPTLAEQLQESPASGGDADTPITAADLQKALSEQRVAITEEFKDAQLSEEEIEERANEIVTEREELRELADHAKGEIGTLEENGLPSAYGAEIAKNYMLLASGPRAGLVVEEREVDGKTLSKKEVITEAIKADAETAVKLMEAAGAKPRIKGLGASNADKGGDGGGKGKTSLREATGAFGDFLAESGDLTGDPEKDEKHLAEMLEEGS